jgi:hypothetical protein
MWCSEELEDVYKELRRWIEIGQEKLWEERSDWIFPVYRTV